MTNPTGNLIKERIQEFVTELDALVRLNTLQSIHDALDAPTRRQRGRPKRAANAGDLSARITSHVAAHSGQTVGQVVAAVGAEAPTVKKAIQGLLASKTIRKAGERRGTRYYPAGAGPLPGARTKSKRKARRKPRTVRKAPKARKGKRRRTSKSRAILVPAKRRPAPTATVAATRAMTSTDVPLALAVGQ